MTLVHKFLSGLGQTGRVVAVSTFALFLAAGIAQATATTIGANVSTTGTLDVTGQTTLGQATSTRFSAYSAYFGGSATSTFSTAGALTLVAGLSGTSGTFSTTLSVTGLATLLGGATTTSITLLTGDKITNAVASTTVVSGNLTIGDATAVSPSIIVTNAANATSSISVGCIQATATSSATKVKIVFSTLGATSTFAGTAYWSYGQCP